MDALLLNMLPPPNQIVGGRTVVQNDHDSLFVRTLAMDDGDTKLLMVVLDIQGYDDYQASVAKQEINSRTGIPVENIMISITHTHSGLPYGRTGRAASINTSVWTDWVLDAYQRFVVDRIVLSAEEAVSNLEPAHIGWGKADIPQWVHNRRFKMKTKQYTTPWGEQEDVVTHPSDRTDIIEPLGPVDIEASFITVKSTGGRPIALFASYSPHYPADIPEPYISADYYGVFSKQIQTFLKANNQAKPFVGSMAIGTAGDLASIDRRVAAPSGTILQRREQMGFDVARAIYLAHSSVKYKPWVKLGVAQSTLQLDSRKATTQEQIDYAEFLLDRVGPPEFINHRLETNYATHILRMLKIWPDKVSMTVQAFRIGDLAIVAIPGEVFAETGLSIKANSPFAHTYTNQLSNGGYGYLPTETQHDFGGYETWIALSNRVERAAATKIETEVQSLLRTLKQ